MSEHFPCRVILCAFSQDFALMWLHLIRPRPPNAQKESSSTRLLSGFIGISPLRLHYGRAANYGSIIIPCACHRHHRKQSGFRCISFIARFHKEGLGAPTSRLWVSPTQVMYLMTVYLIFKELDQFIKPLTTQRTKKRRMLTP